MKNIKIMDCTLRDGGWVNDFQFGIGTIEGILGTLEKSGIEYVELGYMDRKASSEGGRTVFSSYDSLRLLGEKYSPNTCRMVMIDYGKFSVDSLPNYNLHSNNIIDGIRVCFHKKDLDNAIEMGNQIVSKGYQLFMQPMVTTRYSDDEFKSLLEKLQNELEGFSGVYVVDSFGSMTDNDIQDRLMLAHGELDKDKILGLHVHNNLNRAFDNAKRACSDFSNIHDRELIIDSTLMGMGKGAGNLSTEDFTELMNREFGGNYDAMAIKNMTYQLIAPIRERFSWGCTPEYELSAKYCTTPTYVKLFRKNNLSLQEIEKFLSEMPDNKRDSFDKAFAKEYLDRRGR